jgi:Holliday junction resolvase
MAKYHKGSRMEREVIHDALNTGKAMFGMRGAGSKSYSTIGLKVDVVLLSEKVLTLIQCKNTKSKTTKERRAFFAVKLPDSVKVEREYLERGNE